MVNLMKKNKNKHHVVVLMCGFLTFVFVDILTSSLELATVNAAAKGSNRIKGDTNRAKRIREEMRKNGEEKRKNKENRPKSRRGTEEEVETTIQPSAKRTGSANSLNNPKYHLRGSK